MNYYENIKIELINNKEYERLDSKTKEKLINSETNEVTDYIKSNINKNKYNYEDISEKMLKGLILEDISSFMKELGNGFAFMDSEYKIKI